MYLDSVTHGALNSPWGARTALPFYAQFQTFNEAYDYCKKKLEPMLFMGEQACVIWDSDVGRQIIETFVLSEDVGAFCFPLAIFITILLRQLYWELGINFYSLNLS